LILFADDDGTRTRSRFSLSGSVKNKEGQFKALERLPMEIVKVIFKLQDYSNSKGVYDQLIS